MREPGMLPPPVPERPRGYSSTVPPVWISRPDLHPLYPPDRYFGAVGSSLSDWDDAGLVARRRLWNDIALRMNATRQRAEIVHPYVGYQGEFAARVADAFTADGFLARRLGALVHEDSSSFVRYQGVYYAFAYLDRALVDSVFASSVARQDSLVAESVDYALSAAEAESWFGFAHWSRRSLTREADRLASWVVRNALGGEARPVRNRRPATWTTSAPRRTRCGRTTGGR